MTTPIRGALAATSTVRAQVKDGLGALKPKEKPFIHDEVKSDFIDSLDVDEAMRATHGSENRWDYLLGHGPTDRVIGLEPHSASTSEVSTVIAKRRKTIDQLRGHLKPGQQVAAWFWVASGRVDLVPHDKQLNRLNQEGITFVGSRLLAKHLKK